MENFEDEAVEFRSASRYESEAKGSDGKSFVRVTSYETKRTVSSHGDSDFFNKHISITTPDHVSGEVFLNTENNRSQNLRKLRSTFLSNLHDTEDGRPDPFARFNTRSMPDAGALHDRVIEIHKFPFAEPFSTPNSIKKEQISYSTTTQLKSGQKVTNTTKTEMKVDNGTCSIIETNEVTTFDDDDTASKPTIEEITD